MPQEKKEKKEEMADGYKYRGAPYREDRVSGVWGSKSVSFLRHLWYVSIAPPMEKRRLGSSCLNAESWL